MAFDFSREWPFFPDDEKLRVFEPRANVAILIGHTAVEIGGQRKADPPLTALLQHLPATLDRAAIAAVGTIATLRDGVERVVQNLLTNPYVTVLFLCGEDSPVFYPLEGIACLYKYGVDDGRHVVAGNGAGGRAAKVFARDALATISAEEIACFRARELEIVDCRGAVDPAVFFAKVATQLPHHVQPVANPSWDFLDTIDVYRWRPRTLQIGIGEVGELNDVSIAVDQAVGQQEQYAGLVLHVEARNFTRIDASGPPASRAQRAVHTLLRLGLVPETPARQEHLAGTTLRAERASLSLQFPSDSQRIGVGPFRQWDESGVVRVVPWDEERARPSPIEMDPKGFFKIRVLYEQGVLAADYLEASGRHVETLQAKRAEDLLAAIVAGDYVSRSSAGDQHLVYLGVQIARADFALRSGLAFEEGQPLSDAARKNVDHHLYSAAVVAGSSLEDTWVRGLTGLREQGLLTSTQKGRVAEGWCTFFVVPDMARMTIPEAYAASEEHIEHYAAELLAAAPEVRARGDYTYGDRTCHFRFDQIAEAGRRLAAHPDRPAVNQRWFPEVDLPASASHRPCLVFDVWFHHGGRLHTLQIARSHDVYGGLPQNALGVARGWGRALAAATGSPLGDLCFLSISNNFRVGDDAENVRRAIQGGVHAGELGATLRRPDIGDLAAASPIAAVVVDELPARAVGSAQEVLSPIPALGDRLLRYQGALDQVATVVDRLRAEIAAGGRDHGNSLLLSPRDPVVDRDAEATPLVCMQLRRQLGRLHAASVVLGRPDDHLVSVLHDLQRIIATAVALPLGSAVVVRIDPKS